MLRRIIVLVSGILAATLAGFMPAQAQRAPYPDSRAVASVVGATTTVTYMAFIPQNRVDAPVLPVIGSLCTYGKGYQFGGDGHSAFDWKSSRYRVALHAVIDWKAEKVTGYKSVQPTTVWKKSTGKLVAQKTASSRYMYASGLGWGTHSGSRYVEIRMVVQATNPFCTAKLGAKGAINSAFTIRLYKNGWWEIRSGSYRRMPNTYVYIYNRGHVSDVLKERYSSPYCLIGMSGAWDCEEGNLSGFTGDFS